ncbi:MAG: shikimate dehydrogenase [Chloroflexi bacterium]|nr:shikimate dehydrogenase [Chloroflexota bacterium]
MQNAAFAAMGLPHRYHAMQVAAGDLQFAVQQVRGHTSLGANVTIPHKERIVRLLDGVEETAQRIGAVNTLFKRGGALRGDNTDAGGFADALAEMDVDVRGARVLLLGAGGAAKACGDQLTSGGARVVSIANRGRERADALATALVATSRAGDPRALGVVAWPPRSLEAFDVVVNATSLGLQGEDALEGVDLPRQLAVVDVVATARETPLIRRAKASGCVAVDGLLMLLHQGARAFRLWTGLDAPVAAMRAALPRQV